MTLPDAIKYLGSRFKSVSHVDRTDPDPSLPLVCSGASLEDVKGVMPALFVSEDLAVDAWLKEFNRKIRINLGETWEWKKFDLEWVYSPELLDFQMTMADRNGGHRLVSKRYAVRSQMRVK